MVDIQATARSLARLPGPAPMSSHGFRPGPVEVVDPCPEHPNRPDS